MKKITLYHTNDLHSHFENWPRIIGYLNAQKAKHDNNDEAYLLLDLGDHADRFHPITEGTMGAVNVALLNEAGYDIITIGNNEGITFTKKDLNAIYSKKKFDVILANLFNEMGERPEWCEPYQIINIDGLTIGFTAVTAPFAPFYSPLGWEIRNPFEVLPPIVSKLQNETDIVILLSHLGLPMDEKVAKEIKGLDVILGAHTHHTLEEGQWIKKTLITQAGKFGNRVGRLEIKYDDQPKKVHQLSEKAVNPQNEPDIATENLLKDWHKKSNQVLTQPLAVINGDMPADDFNDNELGKVLADTLRRWCESDLAMVNAGIIVDDLKKGTVTRGDLHRVCPHPINPCKVTLTGQEIISIINKGIDTGFQSYILKGFGFRGKRMGKLIFSGLTYDVQEGKPLNVRIMDHPVNLRKKYEVATTDMFTFGQLLPEVKAAKEKTYYLPEMLRDLLAWALG